jgi:hypothetical protein
LLWGCSPRAEVLMPRCVYSGLGHKLRSASFGNFINKIRAKVTR